MKLKRTSQFIAIMIAALIGTAVAEAEVLKVNDKIPGRYIVVLKSDVARAESDSASLAPTVSELANKMAARFGARPGHSYSHALKGFVADLDAHAALALAEDPRVAFVVEDGIARIAGVQVDPPSWGLDRVDQVATVLDGRYVYYGDGSGVHVYIIDSGVRSSHVDFGGRVDTINAFTTVDDGLGTEDGLGHGTAVAAIAAGTAYGVAKAATIHPVRVLDADGIGSVSDVIAGIDWVTATFQAPAVANISITASPNPALDAAISSSIAAGVFYTVAASNGNTDACLASPARVQAAFTIGATNQFDDRASFSDFGRCVDIFAPGEEIITAWARDDLDEVITSGTSFAAPVAAGTAALYLQQFPFASDFEVTWALLNSATQAVPDDGTGSPNGLVYSSFVGEGIDQPPFATFTATCKARRCRFNAGDSTDDHKIVSYGWGFGDGEAVTGKKNPRIGHRFPKVGDVFTITLTVTDDVGQSTQHQADLRFSY